MVVIAAAERDMLALFTAIVDFVLVVVAGVLVKENFPGAYEQFGWWLYLLIPVIVLVATIRST